MTRRIVVPYIAGKYRAPTMRGIHENIERARACAADFWAAGAAPLTPHTNSAFLDGVCPDAHFLAGGLVLLERCDFLVLLPGWKDSEGTKTERVHALAHGMPVFEWLMAGDAAHILADYAAATKPRSLGYVTIHAGKRGSVVLRPVA